MNILRYPLESLNPFNEEGRVLDPVSVMSKLFAIRANSVYARNNEEALYPLSWALRMSKDFDEKSGQVLGLLYKMANNEKEGDDKLAKLISAIDELFPDLVDYKSSPEIELMIKKCMDTIDRGLMIHVSSPTFHLFWEYLEKCSNIDDYEILRNAKQHWSIHLPLWMERSALDLDGFVCLQSGGGHLLILKEDSKSPEDDVGDLLKKMKDSFLEETKEDQPGIPISWSPPISASFMIKEGGEGGSGWQGLRSSITDGQEDGDIELAEAAIEELSEMYKKESGKLERENIKRMWARYGVERRNLKSDEEYVSRIYLDFMGLGHKCWPKSDSDVQSQESEDMMNYLQTKNLLDKKLDDYRKLFSVPTIVPVKDSRKGFERSLALTGFIESTIGSVLSNICTSEIHTLGGDEIEANIDARDFHILIDVIEKHSLDYHLDLLPNSEIELSWWLACIPLQSSSEHDSLLKQIKRAKNGTEIKKYRDADSSDGPLDMGTNFVHIIWLDSLIELDKDKN
tara:strand:+ start:2234 stop:3769 length:1536 start_codon:yes stop_codon:yes gene_type:complete